MRLGHHRQEALLIDNKESSIEAWIARGGVGSLYAADDYLKPHTAQGFDGPIRRWPFGLYREANRARGEPPMKIRTKRIYEEFAKSDGRRILIDRLWPRGVSKEDAQLDYWAKSVSPSKNLRQWYQHDPTKWMEFRERYFAELDANPEGIAELEVQIGSSVATLLFGSKEDRLNNATALRDYLESK